VARTTASVESAVVVTDAYNIKHKFPITPRFTKPNKTEKLDNFVRNADEKVILNIKNIVL